MERKDIDIKDTWDLSTIYNSHEAFYQDLEKTKSLINDLITFKGKICNSIDSFYNFLTTKDTVERLMNKLYCYAHLNCDVEPKKSGISNYDGHYNGSFRSFVSTNIICR